MKKETCKKWFGIMFCVLLLFLVCGAYLQSSRPDAEAAPVRDTPLPPPITDTDEAGFLDDTVSDDTPWYLLLVNSQNPVPENYSVSLVEVAGGEQVDERIYDPLMEMLEDAREANRGELPVVVSGYRTTKDQERIYQKKIKKYRRQGYSESEAEELAGQYAARPGCSEHQLGLAVDINGATYDVYLWLQENSYKYGFIFRYPGNKTELTGIAEEVWHYRYVGVEAAAEIFEQGVCLEEYTAAQK